MFSTVVLQMSIHVDKDEPCECLKNLAYLWKVGIRVANEWHYYNYCMWQACRSGSLLVKEILSFLVFHL